MKKEKSYTNLYLYIAILVLFAGFIVGLTSGEVFKTKVLTYESPISSKYNTYEESFNTGLMFYIWIATAIFDTFVFGIYSICHRLDLLIDKKTR